jgi:hypothetical protein
MTRLVKTAAAGLLALALCAPTAAHARRGGNGNNGSNGNGSGLPNGKPFQILQQEINQLQTQLAAANAAIQNLQTELSQQNVQNAFDLGNYVTVDTQDPTVNGLKAPNVFFEGANFHVESGSGATVDTTGLGNLVIGYDEDSLNASAIDAARTGSHNLIVGPDHEFTSSGGVVAGFANEVAADYASVVGGEYNLSAAPSTSVSGGNCNVAGSSTPGTCPGLTQPGEAAVVSGGSSNAASGQASSIGGGATQTATSTDQNVN